MVTFESLSERKDKIAVVGLGVCGACRWLFIFPGILKLSDTI